LYLIVAVQVSKTEYNLPVVNVLLTIDLGGSRDRTAAAIPGWQKSGRK
jgi:hypothetical protein